MFVMTRERTDEDEVKDMFITNPRLEIDDIRKIKAMIRFKTKNITVKQVEEGLEAKDIHTLMKFGRCLSISTIGGALYRMVLRLAGKEQDNIYVIQPIYKDGNIDLTIVDAYSIDKHTVNI